MIFVLGRLTGAKGPGLFLVPPLISHMSKVDLRIVTLTVPPQEVITRDNDTIKVTAVLYFYVVDPMAAIVNVMNFKQAITQIGQTTLRNVLGQSEMDELLASRDKINRELQVIIDEQTEHWGVKMTVVEIKDVELPMTMLEYEAAFLCDPQSLGDQRLLKKPGEYLDPHALYLKEDDCRSLYGEGWNEGHTQGALA